MKATFSRMTALLMGLGLATLAVFAIHAATSVDRQTQGARVDIDLAVHTLRTAPAFCVIEFGGVSGYLSSCIRAHAMRPNLLPRDSVVLARDQDQTRRLYAADSMAENGWSQH